MTPEDMRRRVERSASGVSLALYEGVAAGLAVADARLRGFPHRESYPHLLPLMARAGMRNHWLDQGLTPGWRIGGNPRLMGQTLLLNDEENLELRLLKERRRAYPGGVPTAGSNAARRGYWEALPLGFTLPGNAILEERVRLLALWDRHTPDQDEGFTVRVVHTVQPGVYGRRVPVDLSYEVKPTGGIFDQLRFRGDPQDDDFFGADIDRAENEGDGVAQ